MDLSIRCRGPGVTRVGIERRLQGSCLRSRAGVTSLTCVACSFIALLRRYRIALVVADTAGKWPYREDLTADFVYVRLHGDKKIYASGYSDRALDGWAKRIRAWSCGAEPADARLISSQPAPARASRDVYCYFDNDVKVHAPFDAQRLMERLGFELGRKLRRLRPRVRVEESRRSRRPLF